MFIIYGLLSDLWQSLGVVLDVQFFLWDCTSSGSHMNSVNQLTRIESVKSFHIRLPIFESIEFAISILNTQ